MAHISIGDTVRYLNAVGGGKVTRIISPTMVEILDESGFEIPVSTTELLVIKSHENKPEEEIVLPNIEESNPITYIEGNDELHILLGFVPISNKNDIFSLYVINDSNNWITYLCAQTTQENQTIIDSGSLEPNTKIQITQLTLSQIHEIITIHFQGIVYKPDNYTVENPISTEYHVEHTKFHKSGVFRENDFFEEAAYIINLHNTTFEKIQKSLQKEDIQKLTSLKQLGEKRKPIQHIQSPKEDIREIDLHIHELVDDDRNMSATDKLATQITAFEQTLSKAIQDSIPKLVCIHGVGNGILKSKIRSILDHEYPHLFYQDASFQKYKFGATLIYLKKIHT